MAVASASVATCMRLCQPQHKQPRRGRPCNLRAVTASSSVLSDDRPVVYISSTQNVAVKHCVKLRQSGKYRQWTGSALVSGRDLVEEVALADAELLALVGLEDAQLPDIAAVRYVAVTQAVMQKITGLETVSASTLAAEVVLPQPADLLARPAGQLTRVLVLDGIQDPGNLGTLLRTALALGWQAAVLLPGCCDPFNDKALRASRGACFKLPIAQYSLQEWQELVQTQGLVALAAEPDRTGQRGNGATGGGGSTAVGEQQRQGQQQQQQQADGEAQGSLPQLQQHLRQLAVCLCLGAEGQGLSEAVRQQCRSVSIPQSGDIESLNVGAAGAILMFALSRGAAPLLAELASLGE